jgi:hypothetical protein
VLFLSVDCSESTLRLFRDVVLHVSSGLDLFGTTVLYHDPSVSSRRRAPSRDMNYLTLFLTEILFLFLFWVFVEYGSASGEERREGRETIAIIVMSYARRQRRRRQRHGLSDIRHRYHFPSPLLSFLAPSSSDTRRRQITKHIHEHRDTETQTHADTDTHTTTTTITP